MLRAMRHRSGHNPPLGEITLMSKLFRLFWLPPRDSNPDMLIQSLASHTHTLGVCIPDTPHTFNSFLDAELHAIDAVEAHTF